jgi:nucleoside-diphosphate-sugar epimerase
MKIFMTGAAGYVGSAILDELLPAGHDISALARSPRSEAALAARGVTIVHGDLANVTVLEQTAAQSDVIVHTGFDHDFTKFRDNCEQDQRAIAAMGRGIAGSEKRFIVTSAIGILPRGRVVDEDSQPSTGPMASPRALTEAAADTLRQSGTPVQVVRLPPTVHGEGDPNFVATLVRIARQKGVAAYVGTGDNRWPAVERRDAARFFARLVTEKPTLQTFHAVAETGVRLHDIARAIGEGLNLPVISISPDEVSAHFGDFAHFATMDVTASSEKSAHALNWSPKGSSLLQDIQAGLYFK